MDVHVEAAGGDDLALGRDHFGARPDYDIDSGLHVGISGLADAGDAAVADPDVRLDDAPVIEDQRVRDDGIDRPLGTAALALAHAVADHLAATELHLLAVDRAILFHLEEGLGAREPYAVADRGSVHIGIGGTGDLGCHGWRSSSVPEIAPWNPCTARSPA